MATEKKIMYLTEHNGSLPIFLDFKGKPGNITAYAVNDLSASSIQYYSYWYYFNMLGLGKLTNNLYILEDLGTYDNNVEIRATLTFTPSNTNAETKYGYAVRCFEYQQGSNRLYTNKRGSSKVLLISGDAHLNNNTSYLIKWEKNLPPSKEVISDDKKSVKMYSLDETGLTEMGTVTLTNTIGTTEVSDDIFTDYYIDNMDFYSLDVNYSVNENNTNEPKYGLLAITSSIDKAECGYFNDSLKACRTFVNYWGYLFIILAPKSGWICVKTPAYSPSYQYSYRRTPVYFDSQGDDYVSDPTENHICIDGAELNGFYMNTEGKYEIPNTLPDAYYSTENANYFSIYVPTIFNVTSYEIVARAGTTSSNMPERVNMYQYITNKNTFINDLDGIEYTAYMFDCADYLEKIILTVQ